MIYIYDVLLNFNTDLIEFFEWEEDDLIVYIKKIPIYKVNDKFIFDLINNKIKVDNFFLEEIKNKTYFCDNSSNQDFKYCVLFTNLNTIIGVCFNNNGNVIYLSKLLVEEEQEILIIANRLSYKEINYEVLDNYKRINDNLTRKERYIKNILLEKINELYINNNIEKLNYLYYEYFNKVCNNKKEEYEKLIDSINNFNYKHKNLYDILKLSEQK